MGVVVPKLKCLAECCKGEEVDGNNLKLPDLKFSGDRLVLKGCFSSKHGVILQSQSS